MSDKPMMSVPVPDATQLDLKVPGELSFSFLMDQGISAREEIKKLKEVIAATDLQVGAILDLNQLKTVSYEGYTVSRREGSAPRPRLSRTKLALLGVASSILEQATEYGKPGKPGVVVRKAGETAPDGSTDWEN